MPKKRLFVSFDYDNDEILKTFLIGQSKHEDTPFDVTDASVKEHLTGDWQAKVRARINNADVVCVLCGTKTHTASGCRHRVLNCQGSQEAAVLAQGVQGRDLFEA